MNSQGTAKGRACLWLLALWVAGCSRGPVAIPVQPIEDYRFQETRGEVRVALDPFYTAERTKIMFAGGETFPEKGLFPIQVLIENGSAGDIQVSPRGFRLVRPNGDNELALSPQDAFEMVKLPWGLWAVIPIIGGGPSAYRNEARLKDIESQALLEATVPRGKSVTGFVYFVISENEQNLAGTRVLLSLRGPGGRDLSYEIAVSGRRDIPVPAKKPEVAGSVVPSSPGPSGSKTHEGLTVIEGTGGRGVIIRSPAQ